MRISITDRCNLRCRYCMPAGAKLCPREEILTYGEILRLARLGAELGIRHVKVTGGEPLVRKNCSYLIKELKKLPGIENVTMTTNGVRLKEELPNLLDAGLDAVNISLDTLERAEYGRLTGFDKLPDVLEAMEAAVGSGIRVKVNGVLLKNAVLSNYGVLLRLAEKMPVDVRLIEMMPIGLGKKYAAIGHGELLEELQKAYPGMEKEGKKHGFGPAVYYRIPGWRGSIGFISAVHGKFCENCNRVRLTSKGFLKTCLCYEDGVDLRELLRGGARDGDIRTAMEEAISRKPVSHCFGNPGQMTESGGMSAIGG